MDYFLGLIEFGKYILVFDCVMKNKLKNNLLTFFFSNLLKEWKPNLTYKKVEGGLD